MPTYEFYCRECAHKVAIFQKMDSSEGFKCPLCNSAQLTRIYSQVAIVKSGLNRVRDVSWIDQSIKAKVGKNRR